jgi:hypothetical protein
MTLQTRTVALADLELDVDINARRHRTDESIEELKASIRCRSTKQTPTRPSGNSPIAVSMKGRSPPGSLSM